MLTKDDFIRMAKEAGMELDGDNFYSPSGDEFDVHITELVKFAALVATHIEEQIGIKMLFDMVQAVEDEREECAKVAEERWLDKANCTAEEMYEMQKKNIAEAIRARGQQ
jgi:hypothetical protein